MPKPKPSSSLVMVETAFLASTTAMLFLINSYFPLGPFLRMFFPIPIALAYLRWGKRAAWMSMIVTTLLLSVLMGPIRSIQYAVQYGLVGVLLGYLWRHKVPWAISLPLGTMLGALGTVFQFLFLSLLVSENLWNYTTVQMTGLISWLMQLFGSLDQPELAVIQAFAVGGIVFSNLMYQLLVHLVAWVLLDRLGNPIPSPPKWLESLLA
ncbi:DUF2232 domain-containing protein [Tumidithrix elongata RA019]|uniref:DUF2232 domain-containing protein n=1 Tax=Tumidithrix elongata BACA0141 TaxID=2716417 RepID=A0AAW9Q2N8_9CYAN|nr:DUF2232 domain-containing protein [Tumidithrix elongata RA019]